MKFKEHWVKKFGVAGAGPVPNSLLARQDLEGEEREKGIATDDALQDLADDAAVAGTKKEKKTIKSDIISTQKERQIETLRLRGKLNKSFKEIWKSNNV